MGSLSVSKHPLLQICLTAMRDMRTETDEFRTALEKAAELMVYEATASLRTETFPVTTGMHVTAVGYRLADRILLVPIWRAGEGMAVVARRVIPRTITAHAGMYRDHETRQPVWYYDHLDRGVARCDVCLILDPMLATGGSAADTSAQLKKYGAKRIIYVGLFAAPEGVERMQTDHPDVPLYLGVVDDHLDENKYIIPGLGDAGDRQFGTG